jgi:hypothetical protein
VVVVCGHRGERVAEAEFVGEGRQAIVATSELLEARAEAERGRQRAQCIAVERERNEARAAADALRELCELVL